MSPSFTDEVADGYIERNDGHAHALNSPTPEQNSSKTQRTTAEGNTC
jgi:hypothetical protein